MSRIAAALAAGLLAVPALAAAVPMTAEQALKASRAATSIGPDPCRAPVGDEIVICGRKESPYALPLYDPMEDDDASKAGGNRAGQMKAVGEANSACAQQGAFCQPPAAVNLFQVVPVLVRGIRKLIEGE